MDGKRQNLEVGRQHELAWTPGAEGEARSESGGRAEPDVSGHRHESPTEVVSRMQEVLSADNLRVALRQVQGNKGSPGIDGMTVTELPAYLKTHWRQIKEQLMQGRYRPQPVKRVEIPKPDGGVPLLLNLVLDELDKELERRGHAFVRYADDCNIYVHSERAGQRVMAGVSRSITEKLKLKVNTSKSAVARPSKRKFLGFCFTGGKDPKRRDRAQGPGAGSRKRSGRSHAEPRGRVCGR